MIGFLHLHKANLTFELLFACSARIFFPAMILGEGQKYKYCKDDGIPLFDLYAAGCNDN